jgi:hypothetical protein
MTGDFQATVTALTRPAATDVWAKAGLMVRDSLEPGARHAHLCTTPVHGLSFHWRPSTNDYSEDMDRPVISHAALKLPIMLRLIRSGDTITAQYSTDHGKTFRAAGDPLTFDPPLPKSVYVGLAITAHNANKISEARFRDLQIQRR